MKKYKLLKETASKRREKPPTSQRKRSKTAAQKENQKNKLKHQLANQEQTKELLPNKTIKKKQTSKPKNYKE